MNSPVTFRYVGPVAAAMVCLALTAPAQAGPVAYWTFDNTVDDSVGSSHGMLNGAAGYSATVPGPLAYSAASLDVNDGDPNTDWFSAPVNLGIQGSYTISAWTRMRDAAGSRTFFDARSGGATYDAKFGVSPVTGNPAIHTDVGRGASWIDTGADADFAAGADTWYHVACVLNQWGYQIYVDGNPLAPVPGHGGFATDNPVLFTGTHEVNVGRYSGGLEYFNGQIDDVAVWNTALPAGAVAQLAAGVPPTSITETRNVVGALKYVPITGDDDSQISTAKTYTHKLDFGTSGMATVNGVAFDQGQAGDYPTYSCDIPSSHPGGGEPVPVTGAVASVFQDMNYNNADATLMLKGLTVGQAYDARLYMRSWEQGFDRTQTIQFDVDADGVGDRTIRVNEDNAAAHGIVYAPGFDNDLQAYALSCNFLAESPEMAIRIMQRGGGSFHIYGLTNEETDRRPIDTLFSTGLAADGSVLAGGMVDPHYVLVSGPEGDPGELALAVTNHPAWAFNDEASGVISLVEPGTTSLLDGIYTYRTTFDLAGFVPETAEILMTLIADNEVSDVRLNGVSTGIEMVDDPDHVIQFFTYENSRTFLLDGGFQSGVNTLEFDLVNLPPPGPAALRVEMSGTALIPEPSTLALAATGLLALLGCAWRRRRSRAA